METCLLSNRWSVGPGRVFVLPHTSYERLRSAHDEELRDAYAGMLDLVDDLPCAPRLEFVRSLGGAVGFYLDGLIVVGLEDAAAVAQSIWHVHAGLVHARVVGLHGYQVSAANARQFLYVAVLGRVMAHELAHALQHRLQVATPFANAEAGADFVSGAFDKARGRDPVLGELVFRALGCRELLCTHPNPAGRAYAYLRGRQAVA